MKTLVVYFSRTGTTKILAEALAKEVGADIEELKDGADYSGVIGWMKAGRAALKKTEVKIHDLKFDPAQYEMVIIGTPVWAGLCAPAVRAYIKANKQKFKRVSLFSTQGGAKRQRVFDEMKEQLGQVDLPELFVLTKEVRQGNFINKLQEFIKRI